MIIVMSRFANPPKLTESFLRFQCSQIFKRRAQEQGLGRGQFRPNFRANLEAVTGKQYPRQTIDNWVRGDAMPNLEDMPAVDQALGAEKGYLLTQLDFIDVDAVAMRWLRETPTISELVRPFVLETVAMAQAQTMGEHAEQYVADEAQGRLVS